jgi:hypothetical protein
VGALVTLDIPEASPFLDLPWIITFAPMTDDEEWEPVVCGPYERGHAMALAESIVADEVLMAVVEPLRPHVSIDEIRADIATARSAAEDDGPASGQLDPHFHDNGYEPAHGDEPASAEPTPPPRPDEVRAGFVRIASRLTSG